MPTNESRGRSSRALWGVNLEAAHLPIPHLPIPHLRPHLESQPRGCVRIVRRPEVVSKAAAQLLATRRLKRCRLVGCSGQLLGQHCQTALQRGDLRGKVVGNWVGLEV
eukprot:247088-Chlamydomonas_euryale.AAC.2